MSDLISSTFAQTFPIAGQITWTLVDDIGPGGRSVNFGLVGQTTYWRLFWAKKSVTPSTNQLEPVDLLYYMSQALGLNNASTSNLWCFLFLANGTIGIQYAGTTTDGTITDGTGTLARLLGFFPNSGNVIVGAAHGSVTVNAGVGGSGATLLVPPMYFLETVGRNNASGWYAEAPMIAGAALPSGDSTLLTNNWVQRRCTFDIQKIPFISAYAIVDGTLGSPLWPSDPSRIQQPTITPSATMVPPWSFNDWCYTQSLNLLGNRMGCCLGTCAPGTSGLNLVGTSIGGSYVVATLTAQSIKKSKATQMMTPNWPRYYNRTGLELSWVYDPADTNAAYNPLGP